MSRWMGAGGGMCHWPSGSPVPLWLLCCVPCPVHGWEQQHVPRLGSALEHCHAWSLFFAAIFAGDVAGLSFGAGEKEEWCPRRCLSLFLGVASRSNPSAGKCWWCPACDVMEVAKKFCTLACCVYVLVHHGILWTGARRRLEFCQSL